jgi:hypothetical protein
MERTTGLEPALSAWEADEVRSAGVEPATSASSRRPLCQLEYEHMEPIPGADPGRPPYEGGAAAVRIGGAAPAFESSRSSGCLPARTSPET